METYVLNNLGNDGTVKVCINLVNFAKNNAISFYEIQKIK